MTLQVAVILCLYYTLDHVLLKQIVRSSYLFWGEGGECLISHRLPRRSCLMGKGREKGKLVPLVVIGVSDYIL